MSAFGKARHFVRVAVEKSSIGRRILQTWRERKDRSRKAAECARLAEFGTEILDKVSEALRPLGVPYFADYGTLLGLVRDNGFIKHDNDMDFGVLPGFENIGAMLSSLLGNGFVFKRGFEINGSISEFSLYYKKVPVDFFFNFRSGGQMFAYTYNTGGAIPGPDERIPVLASFRDARPLVGELTSLRVLGRTIPAPANPEELLEITYGKNWKTPMPSWSPHEDSGQPSLSPVEAEAYVIGENVALGKSSSTGRLG